MEVTLTASGSATGGEDYTLAGTLTIPANETSGTASLEVVDDGVYEGTETIKLQATATGYAASRTLSMRLEDDDRSSVTVVPTDLSIEEGDSGQYEVRLDSQPTAAVTISMTSSDTDVEVTPASLAFDADDWDTFQAVTVRVAEDEDADDKTATITHTAASSDPHYHGEAIAVPSVSIEVVDDEPPVCESIPEQTLSVSEDLTVNLSQYCSDPMGMT